MHRVIVPSRVQLLLGPVVALAIIFCPQTSRAGTPKDDAPPRPAPTVKITLGPVPASASRPILPHAPATQIFPSADDSQLIPQPPPARDPLPALGPTPPASYEPAQALPPTTTPRTPASRLPLPNLPKILTRTLPQPLVDARTQSDPETRILSPSQGRPIFAQPSGTFTCLLHLPEGEPPRLLLQNSLFPKLRYPLLPASATRIFGEGYAGADISPAASTPPGLYDLVLSVAGREIVNRRSVCVVATFKTSFRFVHLSNMNIGDPTAIDFDPQLPDEINLLAPEFIVATGDFTEWARLCDHPADWQRVLDYMARFEAPVYILCGDHDHEATFTRYIANSPVGTIDYGKYHGLLLLDHGSHPVLQDDDQIRWILQDLEANRNRTFNFVVTHSDELGLLRRLRDMNLAEKVVHDFKLRMIICGGQADWDYHEFASLLSGLPGLHYIRTGQSSTAVRDMAPGQSHYRVIEVNNERVSYVYPEDFFNPRTQYSVPAGRIHTTLAGPNDGTQDVVTVNVASSLNRSWNDCRIWLRVSKEDTKGKPAVVGGTLLRCLDTGASWACQVGFDLPDKGAVTMQAGYPNQLVPAPPVRLEFNCPEQLTFNLRSAPYGLTYFASSIPAILKVVNTSAGPVQVWPIVRLNGVSLSLSGSGPQPLPLSVLPLSTQMLRINLTLGQVAPGPHTIQAYLLDDPLRRLTTQPIVLLLASDTLQGPALASQPATSQPTSAPQLPADADRPE